jgi:hypothetical protein
MTFTATANFNAAKPIINPDDAALLLIDHQSGPVPDRGRHADDGVARARHRAGKDGDAGQAAGDHHRVGAARARTAR